MDSIVLLDRKTISELLTLEACIAAVEAAFASHAEGRSLKPGILHLDTSGGQFHIKVGALSGERSYFACKVNGGSYSQRAGHALLGNFGLMLLYDSSTGAPLAVLESGLITGLRTAAATAVAAAYLARRDSKTLTICGAGRQAELHLRALARLFPLCQVFVWSRNGAAAFSQRLSGELDLDIKPINDLADAGRRSELIVTCTPATSWFLGREHVAPGTFIAAVGADTPAKQELEPALLAASSVVCDLVGQCAEAGELHHAIVTRHMTAEQVRGELGTIIIGQAAPRLTSEEVIIFDSTGTALQDVAAAAAVYERALTLGRATSFALHA